jgi:hypothetical protein
MVTTYEKFGEGGWVTLSLTAALIALCFLIRRHYRGIQERLKCLNDILTSIRGRSRIEAQVLDPDAQTAVLMVGSYAGLGVHSLLSIQRLFPAHFKNSVFVSVGVVDAATFKKVEAVDEVRSQTESNLQKYVDLARSMGMAAEYRTDVGTEVVAAGEELCRRVAREFPLSIFFMGKLVFEEERWYQRFLHNESAYQLQRRLQFAGLQAMVLPVTVGK